MRSNSYPLGAVVFGRLISRYKRFFMDVTLESGEKATVYCPNTGRLEGLLNKGSRVAMTKSTNPKRKMPYTVEFIDSPGGWVLVNSQRANDIVEHAIKQQLIPELDGYVYSRREVKSANKCRFDFELRDASAQTDETMLVEVKNVTMSESCGGNLLATFPDASTERGRKHVTELLRMHGEGERVAMIYLITASDVDGFSASRTFDPAYWKLFDECVESRMRIIPCQFRWNEASGRITYTKTLPYARSKTADDRKQ